MWPDAVRAASRVRLQRGREPLGRQVAAVARAADRVVVGAESAGDGGELRVGGAVRVYEAGQAAITMAGIVPPRVAMRPARAKVGI
jgi:hypothetical protein